MDNEEKIRQTGMAKSAVVAADMVDFAGIFTMKTFDVTSLLFEQIARFIMLPIAAALTVAKAALSWRNAYLKKFERHATAQASVDTIGAAMIVTAVVCGLVLGPAFGIGAPALFAATFGLGLVFNFISACSFTHKARTAMTGQERLKSAEDAQGAWLGTVVCAFATAGIIAAAIFGYSALAILGIVAGTIAATAAVIYFCKQARSKPDAGAGAVEPQNGLSSEATMQRTLDAKPSPKSEARKKSRSEIAAQPDDLFPKRQSSQESLLPPLSPRAK